MSHSKHALPDTNQSFFDLSTIQLTSLISVPVLSTSIVLTQKISFVDALATIILSNVLLWVIRYFLIKMSYEKRKSAIDIAEDYLGEWGGRLAGIVFLISAFLWFDQQTQFSSNALVFLWPLNEGPEINQYIQYSIIIGSLSTLFCAFGIVCIKWLSRIAFPLLFFAFLFILYLVPHQLTIGKFNGISISGVVLILGVNLALTIDLPTFFRHSRSKNTSLTALATIQLITLFLSIGALYFGTILSSNPDLKVLNLNSMGLKISLPLLILISTICSNVFNIYACSVGWEVLVPKSLSKLLLGSKEYAILGLGLTVLYISPIQIRDLNSPIEWVDNAEVCLCFIFIAAWFMTWALKRAPNLIEKAIYILGWAFITFMTQFYPNLTLLSWASALIIIPALIYLISFRKILTRS